MPKYEVTINETLAHSIRVWAEDTDEAIKVAQDIIINGKVTSWFTDSLGLDQNSAWVEELEGDD